MGEVQPLVVQSEGLANDGCLVNHDIRDFATQVTQLLHNLQVQNARAGWVTSLSVGPSEESSIRGFLELDDLFPVDISHLNFVFLTGFFFKASLLKERHFRMANNRTTANLSGGFAIEELSGQLTFSPLPESDSFQCLSGSFVFTDSVL